MGKEPTEIVHNRVSVVRAERGLSRQALADALDVHYQTIGYIERGEYNPSLYLALRMAGFFGLPVEAIFSLDELPLLTQQLYPSPQHKESR
jgi:putative transcriptional regulator